MNTCRAFAYNFSNDQTYFFPNILNGCKESSLIHMICKLAIIDPAPKADLSEYCEYLFRDWAKAHNSIKLDKGTLIVCLDALKDLAEQGPEAYEYYPEVCRYIPGVNGEDPCQLHIFNESISRVGNSASDYGITLNSAAVWQQMQELNDHCNEIFEEVA